jgi:hypothetical protein
MVTRSLVVEDGSQEVPELVLGHFARHAPTTHLLVQGIEQLLAGGRPGEGGAAEERAAEAALVAEALVGAIEGHSQAVQQVDNSRRPGDHFLHRRLMLQKLAAVDGVVEMPRLVVAELAGEVVDAIDAPLRTATMRTPQGQQAHHAHVALQLGQFHGRRQTGQTAANYHHSRIDHGSVSFPVGSAEK